MFEAIKRACYSSYGTARLSEEVTTRLATGLGASGVAVATADPEAGALTQIYPHGMSAAHVEEYATLYPHVDARRVADLWRTGELVSREIVAAHGEDAHAGPRLHAVAVEGGALWGWLCMVRPAGDEPFRDDDARLLTRLAPHIGAGLRRAALLDAAERNTADPAAPVVLLVSDGGRVLMRGAGSARIYAELAGPDWNPDRPPPAVSGAIAMLFAIERAATPDDDSALEGRVHARGRSGRWFELTASRAESADNGTVVVVVAPVRAEGRFSVLARLYGLTPRECDVVERVAHGLSTKAIARELDLSPYTVQEHIGRASEKVGVRGRRELVARLVVG